MASSNNDEGTKTPTFMDRFALHLAKELVGSKTVLEVLNQHLPDAGDKSIEFGNHSKDTPLYWRSDLFLDYPADMVDASKWPCSSNNNNNKNSDGKRHLMYLDARFEFCNDKAAKTKKEKKQVKTTWGCFVLHSSSGQEDTTQHNHHHHHHHKYKNYGLYYKSKPMTLKCLEQHVESMDIDLPEQPQNMAKFMKPALVQGAVTKTKNNSKGKNIFPNVKAAKKNTKEFHIQLKNASSIPSENEKNNKAIQLDLYYEELNDRGVLTLELEEEASSPYNELGMEPLYLRETKIMCSTPTINGEEETPILRSSSSGQQGLVGSSPFGSPTPTQRFGSPANNDATHSPAKNNNLVDLQLDQSLDEWFRLPTNDDDDDNDGEDKGKKNSEVAAAAKPSPSVIANNSNKKRPPPNNLQNHGMRKIKKKKKKGGLFG